MTRDEYWELVARLAAVPRFDTHHGRARIATLSYDDVLDALRWTEGWSEALASPGLHQALLGGALAVGAGTKVPAGATEHLLRELAVETLLADALFLRRVGHEPSAPRQRASRLTVAQYDTLVDHLAATARRQEEPARWMFREMSNHPVLTQIDRSLEVLRATDHRDAAFDLALLPQETAEEMGIDVEDWRDVIEEAVSQLPSAVWARKIVHELAAAALFADVDFEVRRSAGWKRYTPNRRLPRHAFENLVHTLAKRYGSRRTLTQENLLADPLVEREVVDLDSALDALEASETLGLPPFDVYVLPPGAPFGTVLDGLIGCGRGAVAIAVLRLLHGAPYLGRTQATPLTADEYRDQVRVFADYARRRESPGEQVSFVLSEVAAHPLVRTPGRSWGRQLDVLRHTEHLEFLGQLDWMVADHYGDELQPAALAQIEAFELAVGEGAEDGIPDAWIEDAAFAALVGDVLYELRLWPAVQRALTPNGFLQKHQFENAVHAVATKLRVLINRLAPDDDAVAEVYEQGVVAQYVPDLDAALAVLRWANFDAVEDYTDGADIAEQLRSLGRSALAQSVVRLVDGDSYVIAAFPSVMTHAEYWEHVRQFADLARRSAGAGQGQRSVADFAVYNGLRHPVFGRGYSAAQNRPRCCDALRHTDHLGFVRELQSLDTNFRNELSNEAADAARSVEEAWWEARNSGVFTDAELCGAARAAFLGDVFYALGLAPAVQRPNQLPGGRAEGLPDSAFDPRELDVGTDHELEHTDDPAIAREIAKDHLAEDPRYYEKLEAMESA